MIQFVYLDYFDLRDEERKKQERVVCVRNLNSLNEIMYVIKL